MIYAVLDVITKAGFGLYILIAARKTRESLPEADGYWTHGHGTEGRIRITDGDGA
jgi:bacteriorhodopsin